MSKEIELNLKLSDISKLSAYYTQARYPNAGLERPSREITREQALEAVETARAVIDEISKAIQDP